MAISKSRYLCSMLFVILFAICQIDCQTFFQHGRYGKRSDLHLRGKVLLKFKIAKQINFAKYKVKLKGLWKDNVILFVH